MQGMPYLKGTALHDIITASGWGRTWIGTTTRAGIAAAALTVAALGVSCAKSAGPAPAKSGKARAAVPVTVALAVTKAVPTELETFGTVQAVASVAIKSQVSERLKQVHFAKGQQIAPGDLLFSVETRPFEVALQQAQATLGRDRVQAAHAVVEAGRLQALVAKNVAAQTDVDKANAEAAALAETVKADEAAIAALQLDLDHCRILSPIAGRAGNLMVTAGNLVKANDVPLVVINQISPIDVFFAIPQRHLAAVRTFMAQGELPAKAMLPGDPDHPETGHLTFIDNAVDTNTGTIQLGATFANAAERLWPGQYVRVRLVLTVRADATVVPARAVQTGTDGQYVFVLQPDQTVAIRPIKTGPTRGDDAVIDDGVRPGEQVVTDGHLQLIDGTKVDVRDAGATAKTAAGTAKRQGKAKPGTPAAESAPAAPAPASGAAP